MRQIPGELLVYDLKRHKAFCLNATAANIWKSCNGERTVAELATELQTHQRTPVDESVVWLALDQLEKSNLLQATIAKPAGMASISRRSLVRAGIVTAVALPIVTMIAAPTAQAAGTPVSGVQCNGRHNSDPGGCGGGPCTDKPGNCTRNGVSNDCKCQ